MTTEPHISGPDLLPHTRVQLIRDRLTVTELNDVTVSHPHCFLSANGTYIVDEALFPRFASNVREKTPDMMASFEALPERHITGRCLVFQNWGVRTWGHFLIFMLPRLAVARYHGIDLGQMPILMSVETPAWQYAALRAFFGLSDETFVRFNPYRERVRIDHAVIPEIPYRLDGFRPGAREIFEELLDQGLCAVGAGAQPSNAIVLIDRRPYLDKSASYKREARNFESLEAELRKHAPDLLVIDPARLSIAEQVELFWNASMVVGEYGSALHNTVFGRTGQVAISIGKINQLQSHICKLMGQDYIAIDAPCLDAEFDIPITDEVLHFKDNIGRIRPDFNESKKKLSVDGSEGTNSEASKPSAGRAQWQLTSGRINQIGALTGGTRYLQIGVKQVQTFHAVEYTHRVGVEPNPTCDVSEILDKKAELFVTSSDEFFVRSRCKIFDTIFLNEAHTFEQTFRDFLNSLAYAYDQTVWIIDNTWPSDFCSALPDISRTRKARSLTGDHSQLWHGDVFKVIFALNDFFPMFDFRTIVDVGNPQTIVTRAPRTGFQPNWNSLEKVSRMEYVDFLLNRDLMRPSSEAEALDWLREALAGHDGTAVHPLAG